MPLFILGCLIIAASGWIALLIKNNRASRLVANLGLWLGSALAAIPVIQVLSGADTLVYSFPWKIPGGSFSFALDGLSAFFCLPVLLIAPLAAVYGGAYLEHESRALGRHWFWYNLLSASMLLVLSAANGLAFLLAWEMMALSSFFLVMWDDELHEVQSAGWIYLIATHIGTVALLIFFAVLGSRSGSLDFSLMAAAHPQGAIAVILFLLAMFGFGAKAGFIPLHVWLPEAHPAAPSHVSALMSGVMIKTGIYGIIRAIILLGNPSAYMGWILVITGIVSGIGGVLYALAQHDLKRLLAYHSVENIGIITLGLGAGVLGMVWKMPALALLGFGGGLLHVVNHAIFKSLLFFGAGSVIHSSGTRNIEALGGIFKTARTTGICFLIGSAAISGLPPFNGFISEFYIYFAGISSIGSGAPGPVILAALIMASLALIGGLALACFAKATGIVFLGEARTPQANQAHEASLNMRWPMIVLSLLCIIIGMLAPLSIYLLGSPLQMLLGTDMPLALPLGGLLKALSIVVILLALLVILVALILIIRQVLRKAHPDAASGTWDCGYAAPDARMQYTASSFADPITSLFAAILGTHSSGKPVQGYFPKDASYHSATPDTATARLYAPLFRLVDRLVAPLRKVQHGNLNGYLLYIAITVIALLVWKTGFLG